MTFLTVNHSLFKQLVDERQFGAKKSNLLILGFEPFIFYTFCRLTSPIFNTVFLIRFGGWTPLTLTHFGKQIPSKVLHIFGLIPVLDNFTHLFSYTFRGMASLKCVRFYTLCIIKSPDEVIKSSDDVINLLMTSSNHLMTSSNLLMTSSNLLMTFSNLLTRPPPFNFNKFGTKMCQIY